MDELERTGADPVMQKVIETLRAPVDLGPGVDRRVLGALRELPAPSPQRGLGQTLLIGGLAVAAGLGAVLLVPTPPPAPAGTTPVRFVFSSSDAARVSIVGDFNDWNPSGTPLRRAGAGEWSITLPLLPGRYRFSFLLDGRTWVSAPRLPSAPDPDFGAPTSVLTVEPSAQ